MIHDPAAEVVNWALYSPEKLSELFFEVVKECQNAETRDAFDKAYMKKEFVWALGRFLFEANWQETLMKIGWPYGEEWNRPPKHLEQKTDNPWG